MIAGNNNNSRKDLTRASKLDFNTKRGDTFRYEFETFYVNELGEEIQYDFDSCTIKMHIKKHPTDKKPYIVCPVSAVNNTMTMYIPANTMNDVDAGVYYYDLELFDAEGYNYTLLYGRFNVKQDVTFFGDTAELVFDLEKLYSKLVYNTRDYLIKKYNGLINSHLYYTYKEWMIPKSLQLFFNSRLSYRISLFAQKEFILFIQSKLKHSLSVNMLKAFPSFIKSRLEWYIPTATIRQLYLNSKLIYTITASGNIAE